MLKIALKSIFSTVLSLAIIVSIAGSSGAANDADVNDIVELENGEVTTGTVLNNTFTVTTPYTSATLGKDEITEIIIAPGSENHDVIALKAGGLLEGTIEEPALSLKLVSGEIVSFEKEKCRKIVLKREKE